MRRNVKSKGRERVKPEGELPALDTTTVGGRVLVFFDSVLRVLGDDPATKPADRPITLTIKKTQELTGLSPRTVTRMIARGRAKQAFQSSA
jgi:hypothetical protein